MALRSIRTLFRSAVAAGALAALVLGADAASAVTSGSGWAGYAATTTTYTSVTATWVEPKVTCGTTDTYASFWVGLDGYADSSVEQIGTEADCVGGKAVDSAWYELYPAAPVTLSNVVAAGDSMTATVSATAKDVFTLTIEDNTAGWRSSSQHTDTDALRSSAEVVLDVPTTNGTLSSSAGSITFTAAEVDGADLGSADPTQISSSVASCGPLIDGTQFTCTW